MEEQQVVDISEEFASHVVGQALNVDLKESCSKGTDDQKGKSQNPILVANEVLKTRQETAIEEAKLQQHAREMDQKDREMDQKDKELKLKAVEQINEAAKSGVTIFSILALGKWLKDQRIFEAAGHMMASQSSKAVLSFLKIFKR